MVLTLLEFALCPRRFACRSRATAWSGRLGWWPTTSSCWGRRGCWRWTSAAGWASRGSSGPGTCRCSRKSARKKTGAKSTLCQKGGVHMIWNRSKKQLAPSSPRVFVLGISTFFAQRRQLILIIQRHPFDSSRCATLFAIPFRIDRIHYEIHGSANIIVIIIHTSLPKFYGPFRAARDVFNSQPDAGT